MLVLCLFNTIGTGKRSLENKMDNPRFIDEEDVPLVHEDEDYDEYDTPNTWRIDDASFTVLDTTEATLNLRLRQKVKRHKITTLYRHLNVTGDLGFANIDRFIIKKNSKIGNNNLLFLDGNNHCQSLTNKLTGEFLVAKIWWIKYYEKCFKLR